MSVKPLAKFGLFLGITVQLALGQTFWDNGSVQFNYGSFLPSNTWSAEGSIIPDEAGGGSGGYHVAGDDTSRLFTLGYKLTQVDSNLVGDLFAVLVTDTGAINTRTYTVNPLADMGTIFFWIPQLSYEFLMQVIDGDVSIDSLLGLNVRIATAGSITVNTISATSLSLGFQGAVLDPTNLETFVIANGLINLNNWLPTPDYVAGAVDFDFGGEWYSAAGNFNPIQESSGAGGMTTTSGDTINYSFMTYRLNDTENYDILGMSILNMEEMTSGSVPFVQPGTDVFPQANMFFVRNASFADLFMLISNPAVETLDSLSTTEIYFATSGEVTFTRTPALWEGIFSAQMFPLGVTPILVPIQNGSFSLTSEPYVSIREMPVHHQPFDMTLQPAYPNPFNPTVHIPFSLNQQGSVELAVYDLSGRLVTTLVRGEMEPGGHMIHWQPVNQSSGIYLVRLTARTETQTQKIIFLK